MEKLYKIGKSEIEGKGLIATKDLVAGDLIGLSHVNNEATLEVGKFHNHSDNANTVNVEVENERYLVVEKPIKKGEEITVNYRLQPGLEQPEDFLDKALDGGSISYPISGEINYVNGNNMVLEPTQSETYANDILGQQTYKQQTGMELPRAQDGIEVPGREGVRENEDGTHSTHLMRTETLDGINWFSFPSLFQNEDGAWVDMSSFLEQDWMPVYQEALKRGEVIDFGEDKEAAIKFGEGSWKKKLKDGGSLPKAQSGTELSMCSNGEWNGQSVKTGCGYRDSAHNLYGSAGMTLGDISDKSMSGSARVGLGYSTHVPYSPITGHLGLSGGTRLKGDEQSMMFNPIFDATGSVGIEGEFGGNSYNWREPWKYGAGIYGKHDLIGGTGTTAGLYGNVGLFSGKVGYNPNTGFESTLGFGIPIRQNGGLIRSFKNKLKNNPIKRKYDVLKYNRSVDAFGNTGLSFSNDLQHPISRGSSILQYRGLQNTNPYTKDVEEMMAEYTIDSAPFKFGSKLGKAPWSHAPLSVIRDADGNIINAEDNKYAIKLQDIILNNKLKWASGNNKPLSLTRKFNENENRTGIHGNIDDLIKKFKSGETFKLGDTTSWSVGTESVQNFGENRYVIKDFDFNTPALLNEYKDLTKSQKKVMLNEREVVLADPKFKVTNFIKNAPRPHGLRIDTKQPELNNTGLQKQFGYMANNKLFWSDGKGGYKKHLEYNTDISKPFDTFGKPNPMYEKYLWLKENDPSFKTTTIPNYGTDIELQLMKKRGGAMKKNKKYAQSPFSKDKLTVIDPTSMVKEIAEIGGFTSEFKNGGTLKLINGYTASKQYDKQRKLPFFAYGGQPNIEGRLYYDQDSQDDLYNFNMIDITDELIKKQNKHNRTKMIIEKYENNLELSATESEHLNSLGLLD